MRTMAPGRWAGSMIIKYVNSSYLWVCTSLSRLPLRAALLSYAGVIFVNGVAAMMVGCVRWAAGWI